MWVLYFIFTLLYWCLGFEPTLQLKIWHLRTLKMKLIWGLQSWTLDASYWAPTWLLNVKTFVIALRSHNTMSMENFGAESVKIPMFPGPTDLHVVWYFNFSSQIWGLLLKSDWLFSWSLELRLVISRNTTCSSMTSSQFPLFINKLLPKEY